MSFIQVSGKFCRDLWPADAPRIAKDNAVLKAAAEEDVVPEEMAAILQWVYVAPDETTSGAFKKHLVLYSSVPPPGCQIAVRIQGFVEHADLGVLGNWKRTKMDAPRAVQTLTLADGGHPAAFAPQAVTLGRLRDTVWASLRSDRTSKANLKKIYLQRKVFTKVSNHNPVASVILPRDDPLGDADKIKDTWAVASKLKTCALAAKASKIHLCNALEIRRGDFVDVTVVFDVGSYPSPRGRDFFVNLSMERIIRLKASASVEMARSRHGTTPLPASVPVKQDLLVME